MLAFLAAVCTWKLRNELFVAVAPRLFNFSIAIGYSPHNVYGGFDLLHVCMASHFSAWNFICQVLPQVASENKSAWRMSIELQFQLYEI